MINDLMNIHLDEFDEGDSSILSDDSDDTLYNNLEFDEDEARCLHEFYKALKEVLDICKEFNKKCLKFFRERKRARRTIKDEKERKIKIELMTKEMRRELKEGNERLDVAKEKFDRLGREWDMILNSKVPQPA